MKLTKISEKYEITEGEYFINVTNEDGKWMISNENGVGEFIFEMPNSTETRAKWSAVASMIKRATKLMEDSK